ncbi:MAG: DUF4185 domain-containing protein [Polyangiaceae bacterium]|nr:DUF4185 domain-containing protein [Polyangiaceae bacterium]
MSQNTSSDALISKRLWLTFGFMFIAAGCSDPAEVTVRSSKEVFVLEQNSVITGRDGGQSGVLFGKSVWAYGDTVLESPDEAGTNWHHNSFSFTSDFDASDGIQGFSEPVDAAGAPHYLVPPTADEEEFNVAHRGDDCAEKPCNARFGAWPGRPIFDETNSRGIIPYGLIYAEPGDFNFHGVGYGFALWNDFNAPPERPVVAKGTPHPTLLFREDEPNYGISPVIRDGQFYAFSCEGDGFIKPCTLGRVPLDQLQERSAWTYWDGEAFTSDVDDADALFDGADIMTVHFNEHLGRWTAIYSDPGTNDAVIRTAPEIWGPYSDTAVLFTGDRKTSEGWIYDMAEHPEFSEENGRVLYVSFSRPTGEGWFNSEIAVARVELE